MPTGPDSPFALVVDDHPIVLMDACDILEDAGFRPLDASNADQALYRLEKHDGEVALLFTDIQMPGEMNGLDLAREAARRWPSIKIMVASGAVTPAKGELPPGAVFIGKPFDAMLVNAHLRSLLPEGQMPAPLRGEAPD